MLTRGMLRPVEDATYFYDAEAAERPIRFIETFLCHFQGEHAGKPFLLEPIQKEIIRTIYGWKWRALPAKRRFTDVWWEGSIGCGKSPLLAALGIYGLVADGEAGAQVYSLAATFQQAEVVFRTAQKFIDASDRLAGKIDTLDRKTKHNATSSTWSIVSGKGPGAGANPSLILADEVHEWPNSGGYDALNSRKAKRSRPLLIAATNTPKSDTSFCGQLRARAIAALNGQGDPALLPIIWAADPSARTDDPAAWREANPLLGVTIKEADVARIAAEEMKDEDRHAEFRRLYLGIRPEQGVGGWLDLTQWDRAAAQPFNVSDLAGLPLYVGLDLSAGNDLCAVAYVWVGRDRFYAMVRFWLPKATAAFYEKRDAVPYQAWADAHDITLTDEPTISVAVHHRIAADIVERNKSTPIRAVCFDRAYSSQTVADLNAAGFPCMAVGQGWGISEGNNELANRLIEGSISIAPNGVLRWCAENATVRRDDRDNLILVKPNAKGTYAGKRGLKVDGITALCTALTHARKHEFPTIANEWKGDVCLI